MYSEETPGEGVVFPTRIRRTPPSTAVTSTHNVVDMYELLVVIHILSAMVWIGGALVMLVTFRNIKRSEGQAVSDRTLGRVERASDLIFLPTPILVIATGLTMVIVSDAWAFSQLWVYLAIGLFVIVLILGAGFGDRMERQMKQAREEGRSLPGVFDRFLRLGFIEMGVVVVIVFLMVYKPI